MGRRIGIILLSCMSIGCAVAMSPSREAYILAHPHGFIDLTITDSSVPLVEKTLTDKDGQPTGTTQVKPEDCSISVKLGDELFLYHEYVWPEGDTAPFAVTSGFRFAAPAGKYRRLELSYGGCRASGVSVTVPVEVRDGMVTELSFDGSIIKPLGIRENRVTTLEDIADRLELMEELLTPEGK